MIEFVEECRREWKRLGVPDPIANEMAVDLTADIEEAEAEGGSAEDVLGNSLFDPRRFAAAWASARGVTGPPVSFEPSAAIEQDRYVWLRPLMVVALAVAGFLVILAASALVVGRHGVAVAASVSRIVVLSPGSGRIQRVIGPGPRFHFFGPGPFFAQNGAPVVAFAFLLFLVVLVALGFAVFYRMNGPRRGQKRRLW